MENRRHNQGGKDFRERLRYTVQGLSPSVALYFGRHDQKVTWQGPCQGLATAWPSRIGKTCRVPAEPAGAGQ